MWLSHKELSDAKLKTKYVCSILCDIKLKTYNLKFPLFNVNKCFQTTGEVVTDTSDTRMCYRVKTNK